MNRRAWVIAMFSLATIALGLAIFSSSKAYSEHFSEHSPKLLWRVISDAESYQDWNPFLRKVEGRYALGARMVNTVAMPDGDVVMASTVVEYEKERLLNQFGGIPMLLTFDHRYVLVPEGGGTRIIQQEEYRGLGALFLDSDWYSAKYLEASEALAARADDLASIDGVVGRAATGDPSGGAGGSAGDNALGGAIEGGDAGTGGNGAAAIKAGEAATGGNGAAAIKAGEAATGGNGAAAIKAGEAATGGNGTGAIKAGGAGD